MPFDTMPKRNKPKARNWKRQARHKWTADGTMLAETARAHAAADTAHALRDIHQRYADALGVDVSGAWSRMYAQQEALAAPIATPRIYTLPPISPEERRKHGQKVIARIRAEIDRRVATGRGGSVNHAAVKADWRKLCELVGYPSNI